MMDTIVTLYVFIPPTDNGLDAHRVIEKMRQEQATKQSLFHSRLKTHQFHTSFPL